MANKLFKGSNKLIWGVVILAIAVFLYFSFKRREGFQANQTVPVGPPTTVPAKAIMPPNVEMSDTSIDDSTSMPDIIPPAKPMLKQPTVKPKTSVSVVRAKLDELKTLVDSM
jgi:hypothetical protein